VSPESPEIDAHEELADDGLPLVDGEDVFPEGVVFEQQLPSARPSRLDRTFA